VNCYPFIEAEKARRRNVKRACELLKVSRAACYAARAGQPCGRDREDAGLTTRITAGHKRSRGRYGAPRIHAELRRQGRRHSRKRVARLMRQAGLAGRAPRRWKKTTIPGPAAAARADAIRRDLPPTPPRSTRGGAGTSPTSRPGRAGSVSRRSSIPPRAASSALPWRITCAPSSSRTPCFQAGHAGSIPVARSTEIGAG
jgi:transposase InsO family protein